MIVLSLALKWSEIQLSYVSVKFDQKSFTDATKYQLQNQSHSLQKTSTHWSHDKLQNCHLSIDQPRNIA